MFVRILKKQAFIVLLAIMMLAFGCRRQATPLSKHCPDWMAQVLNSTNPPPSLLLSSLASGGGVRQAPITKYSNGFFSTEIRLSKTEYKWQLWRTFRDQTGLVSEAVVSDNMVLTFMPTVVSQLHSWTGTQNTDMRGSFAAAHVFEGLLLRYRLFKERGSVHKDARDVLCRVANGKPLSPNDFSNEIQRVANVCKDSFVVLEIETPCNLDLFKLAVEELTRISGYSLAILPPSMQTASLEEMADIVDAARYREAKEGPDIPVFLPDDPPSKVKRDFYLARASHSITNLEDFISLNKDNSAWSGKAQIEIGNLFQRRGQHAQAICAYESAITNYGTSTVPETATCITVSDLANAGRVRCLKTMGHNGTIE